MGQYKAHQPQDTQDPGLARDGQLSAPPGLPADMSMHEAGHFWAQAPQEMHLARSKAGLAQAVRGVSLATGLPDPSLTAAEGQTRPHAPHSMQSAPSMRCRAFASPEIAPTGHARTQAAHPMHEAPMAMLIGRPLFRR